MLTTLRLNNLATSVNAKTLYKQLIRECKKLPVSAQPYYKNYVRQVKQILPF